MLPQRAHIVEQRAARRYQTKQVEAYAVAEDGDWLVITVVVKYF
jgi:hypothetical protein